MLSPLSSVWCWLPADIHQLISSTLLLPYRAPGSPLMLKSQLSLSGSVPCPSPRDVSCRIPGDTGEFTAVNHCLSEMSLRGSHCWFEFHEEISFLLQSLFPSSSTLLTLNTGNLKHCSFEWNKCLALSRHSSFLAGSFCLHVLISDHFSS